MNKMISAAVATVAIFGLSACSGEYDSAPESEPQSVSDAGPWMEGKYDPSVKKRIDRLERQQDCGELQSEFDTAYANDEATRNRTGSGTSDLMDYIDDALDSAGCYG